MPTAMTGFLIFMFEVRLLVKCSLPLLDDIRILARRREPDRAERLRDVGASGRSFGVQRRPASDPAGKGFLPRLAAQVEVIPLHHCQIWNSSGYSACFTLR